MLKFPFEVSIEATPDMVIDIVNHYCIASNECSNLSLYRLKFLYVIAAFCNLLSSMMEVEQCYKNFPGTPIAEAPKKISGVHKRCWKYIASLPSLGESKSNPSAEVQTS